MNGNERRTLPDGSEWSWEENDLSARLEGEEEATGLAHEVVIECPVVIEFVGARLTSESQAELIRLVMQQISSLVSRS
jgi:hypothetical protein